MKHSLFRMVVRIYRALFARKRLYAVNRLLFNLSLRGIGVLNDEDRNLAYTGEEHLLRRVARSWRTRPTVLDVGANVGEYAKRVMRLAPDSSLYAFEPHPKAFVELQRQANLYGYTALNVACGERKDTVLLYDYQAHDGSPHASLHEGVIEALHRAPSTSTAVEMITLDDFLRERGISKVDLVKIDTEGNELKVLEGLRTSITGGMVDMIQFEFNAMNVFSRAFFRDFWAFLPHYDFYRLLPDGPVSLGEYSPIFWELFASQNIVAVRRGCRVRL
jgi:FkbM family methyltransferase